MFIGGNKNLTNKRFRTNLSFGRLGPELVATVTTLLYRIRFLVNLHKQKKKGLGLLTSTKVGPVAVSLLHFHITNQKFIYRVQNLRFAYKAQTS